MLFTSPGDSLGEQIQREFPEARVVKALNAVNAGIMIAPEKLHGESDLFIAGNEADAKKRVTEILVAFGWKTIHDLGDIRSARGMEAYLLLWLQLYGSLKTTDFNVRVVR